MSRILNLVGASSGNVKKNRSFFCGHKTASKHSLDPPNVRSSIGNGLPVQKYVGAMVRWSIRVAIAFENEPLDHGCFSSTFPICPETQDTQDSLYIITRKNFYFFFLRFLNWLRPS